ncbi:WLM domain-containing protein [Pseudomassariella vexata]|uniref:WLM domain-domain-containing protein n=1 Tax=Pseudomassariella vexata TaxID=1141098 RepID=A0A1Y2DY23_9PEZI|nr:WLM domain-containing protein [Pseudomassariella vexata]ORY64137.1 WLM domain-domain-containing protein [Pseudomassariella vexata]
MADPAKEDSISMSFTHSGSTHNMTFPKESTITDLSKQVEVRLSIPISNQKFVIAKLGLLKPPFKDPDLPLTHLENKKITLMGATASEVASLTSASQAAAAREASIAAARRSQPRAYSRRNPTQAAEASTYTFLSIRPLPNLPNPERSRAFLERLKADPGIVAAMKKHQFSVGLLTEMDPLTYTESSLEGTTRILGLNRNRGEVIELRLRTDAYDGYRDYKTIRNTLCHELAHNVHGPHDRDFWDLCHQIEREVARADWKSGGHSVGNSEFYEPPESSEEVAYDHGGWTGGQFVLGGGGGSSAGGSSTAGGGTLSRREIIAKAAEERLKKMAEEQQEQDGQGEGSA